MEYHHCLKNKKVKKILQELKNLKTKLMKLKPRLKLVSKNLNPDNLGKTKAKRRRNLIIGYLLLILMAYAMILLVFSQFQILIIRSI